MLSLDACRTMCRYNRWMNDRLYEVCAGVPDAVRKEDRRAAFGSIHGTLNHLLLTDRAWLGRFTRAPFTVRSLDQELYADFEELRAERRATDEAIERWVDALTQEALGGDLTITAISRPVTYTAPLWFAVQHFFNHQTHHRGQLTTLLEQLGCDSGVTDLMMVPGGPVTVVG